MAATLTVVTEETMVARPIPVDEIAPGENDRTNFDVADLQSLADDIARRGLDQPITVRRMPTAWSGNRYQIVAGERRWRAHKLAGLPTILAFVRTMTDAEAADAMLAENMVRVDLTPLQEARAYQKRIDAGQTLQHIAKVAGKQRTCDVQARLNLLRLCPELCEALEHGVLSVGQAQVIADADFGSDPSDRRELQMVVFRHLREHPAPTLAWLRSHVAELEMKAQQLGMFGDDDFSADFTTLSDWQPPDEEPPLPGRDDPPAFDGMACDRLRAEAEFWDDAADRWRIRWGKPRHAEQCKLVADQLRRSAETVRGSDIAPLNALVGRLTAQGVPLAQILAAME